MGSAARQEFWTPSGVRLRAALRGGADANWLFLPGGPGVGSESLAGLVDLARLPGTSWLVDLPGDGSNVDAPGAPANPYSLWPDVLVEAVDALAAPVVAVGHSTGGEYLLSVPALEERLAGLILISSAPDARWMATFEAMTRANPLPAAEQANQRYERDPSPENLRQVVVGSAPWNFSDAGLAAGRELLARLPLNGQAVEWSGANFDRDYRATWWPLELPTLIISGEEDRIVDQTLWQDPRFDGPNVHQVIVPGAGHWPWIDQPRMTAEGLAEILPRLG